MAAALGLALAGMALLAAGPGGWISAVALGLALAAAAWTGGTVAAQQGREALEAHVAERTRALTRELAEHREREKQRDEFLKLSADLMCTAGRDGCVRRANPAFGPVLGYAPAEMERVRFMDLVHPEDVLATAWRVKRVTAGRAVRSFENRVRHRDGTYRWISWCVTPAPDQDCFHACGRDITALKEAHERIERERERLQLIFNSVPVGISLRFSQPDGAVQQLFNDAHLRICGLEPKAVPDHDDFRRISHPDDYARQLELNRRLEAGEINSYSLEKRYVRPDQRIVWVIFSRERRSFADGRYEELSTVVDITELKNAQQHAALERARFKFIFDSVPIGIALVLPDDADARVVNPAYGRITGIPGAEIAGDVFERATHPEDFARQRPLVAAFKRGEIDRFSLEKRYLHPGGRIVWAELARRMFVDQKTGLRQAITTLVDITERKEAEARLAETHRQLLVTSRAAGMAEVATGVLHNVGNVLNSVNVSTSILVDLARASEIGKLARIGEMLAAQADLGKFFTVDPRAAKVPVFLRTLAELLQNEQRAFLAELGSLRKNIEHIKGIVAMQQGYAKVSRVTEPISAAELVEDALRMNAAELERHAITLVRDFPANPTLLVEKHKVLQILVNLMRNAKYACEESGRPDKTLTVRIGEEPGRVKIAVIDNGVGIPAENLTRIFSHGFTTRKNGHGFGLHSGALAAKELGGALTVQSAGPGQGAAFILELPLAAVAQAA